jgi:hypothetical protein
MSYNTRTRGTETEDLTRVAVHVSRHVAIQFCDARPSSDTEGYVIFHLIR